MNSEAVCRKDNDGDDIICEPIDLDKGIGNVFLVVVTDLTLQTLHVFKRFLAISTRQKC